MPIIGSAAGASMRSLGFLGWKTIISGGTRTEYDNYIVFSFTSTGSLTITNGPVTGDFLLVGGGQPGEAGTSVPSPKGTLGIRPGVGGDGGVVNAVPGGTLSSGTYTVTVGAANAQSSIASPTVTVYSADGGLNNPFTYGATPDGRASGGGAGSGVNGGAAPSAPPATVPSIHITRSGGVGGAGLENNWRTGSPAFYGGGGGGGSSGPLSPKLNVGGAGGGGTGGDYSTAPVPGSGAATAGSAGTALTGGGGGGGGASGYPQNTIGIPAPTPTQPFQKGAAGGAGGSGIVVLRFPKSTVV